MLALARVKASCAISGMVNGMLNLLQKYKWGLDRFSFSEPSQLVVALTVPRELEVLVIDTESARIGESGEAGMGTKE